MKRTAFRGITGLLHSRNLKQDILSAMIIFVLIYLVLGSATGELGDPVDCIANGDFSSGTGTDADNWIESDTTNDVTTEWNSSNENMYMFCSGGSGNNIGSSYCDQNFNYNGDIPPSNVYLDFDWYRDTNGAEVSGVYVELKKPGAGSYTTLWSNTGTGGQTWTTVSNLDITSNFTTTGTYTLRFHAYFEVNGGSDYARVRWDNVALNITEAGDTNTAPSISNVTNSTPTGTQVYITWDTDQPDSNNRVRYSVNPDLSASNWSDWDNNTGSVNILLNGLSLTTTYYYSAYSYNGTNSSLYSNSSIHSFTTADSGDITYDFSSGAGTDKWAYRPQVNSSSPTSDDVPDIQFTDLEYDNISTNNGVLQSDTADNSYYAAHRFRFNIGESAEDITIITVLWNGRGYHDYYTDGATLWIWNYGDSYYEQLDTTTSSSEVGLTGDITSNFGNYLDANGNLTVLVDQNSPTYSKCKTYRYSHIETDYIKVDITSSVANHPPSVTTPGTYNSSLAETYIFEPGETVTVRTNVTDPEGHDDIAAVNITITSPDSTVMVNNGTMTNISAGGYVYEYNYTIPADLASSGYWYVDVYASDISGATSAASTFFKVVTLDVTVNAGGPYLPNDTVNIDGWVLYANGTPADYAAVELNSTDPLNSAVNYTTVYTNTSGYFAASYPLNDTALTGLYTVTANVTAGNLQQIETTTYSVKKVATPSNIRIVTGRDVYLITPQIWLDNDATYYSPRVVNITVLTMDNAGMCLQGQDLNVSVTYPGSSVQFVAMNEYKAGFWNGSFTVDSSDPAATYTINATVTDTSYSDSSTFDVDRFRCDSSNCHNYEPHKHGVKGAHNASAQEAHWAHSPIRTRGGGGGGKGCSVCHTGQDLDCAECHTDLFRGTHAEVPGSTLTNRCNHCHDGYNDSTDTGIEAAVPECSTLTCHGGEHEDKPAYLHTGTHAGNKVDCGYCHNNMHSIFEPTCDLCHKTQVDHSSYNTTGVTCLQCHDNSSLSYSGSVLVNGTYHAGTSIHSQDDILPDCAICHTAYSNHSSYEADGVYCTYCHDNASLDYAGTVLPENITYNTDTAIHTLDASEMKPDCMSCHPDRSKHTTYNSTGVTCLQCHNNATLNYNGTKMYNASYNAGTTIHSINGTPALSNTTSPLCTTCHTKTGDELDVGYDDYAMNDNPGNLAPSGSNMTHKRDTITGDTYANDPPDYNVRYARHANPNSSGGWPGATGPARDPNQICINCHSDRIRYWGAKKEEVWTTQYCNSCHQIWVDTLKPDVHKISIPYCSDCHAGLTGINNPYWHTSTNDLSPPKNYTLTPSIGVMLNDSAHGRMTLNTTTGHPTNYDGCLVCHTDVTFTANSTPDTLTLDITDHSGAHTWNSKPDCTKCHSIDPDVERPGPYPYEHDILNMDWGNNTQCLKCHNIYNQTAGRDHGHDATNRESCTGCHYNYQAMNDYGKPSVYVNEAMYADSVHGTKPGANCTQCHTKYHPPPEYTWKWCECCHSYQSEPVADTNRHNITDGPSSYMSGGVSVLEIIDCTVCHDAELYNNSKDTFSRSSGKDCRYCHTYPDQTYY